jgi:CRP-like cAMP-binding protein
MASPDEILAELPIFEDLSRHELKKIRQLMTPITLPAGRRFIIEGSNDMEAFIILEGEALVERDGVEVARIGPGDVVGEMAVLAGVPRTATVTATTEVTAEVLNRREFISLLDREPEVMKNVLVSALRRLHQLAPPATH